MQQVTKSTERYVRIAQLVGNPKATPPKAGILPISAATIWRGVRAGSFPAPVRLTRGVTAWKLSDIEAWESRLPKLGKGS